MPKTVVVTGASRGIGAAVALSFGALGYNVAVNYINNAEKAQQVVDCIIKSGGNAIAVQADVSSAEQVARMFETVNAQFGAVDILVNNAGISAEMLFTDMTEQQWDHLFAVNVRSVFNCCKQALPAMISAKDGVIINISSIWGISGASCEVAYSATKSAVIGLTKALAQEVGPSGIRVNCVAPGVIDTDMNACYSEQDMEDLRQQTPLMRIGTPQDIADTVLFLASDASRFITGQVISTNGGFLI